MPSQLLCPNASWLSLPVVHILPLILSEPYPFLCLWPHAYYSPMWPCWLTKHWILIQSPSWHDYYCSSLLSLTAHPSESFPGPV
uniref:Putative secreted protein n=1 Tax=Anopheles triannulatus TaxID=58253 RepID=A0A2M4B257_9DIPT